VSDFVVQHDVLFALHFWHMSIFVKMAPFQVMQLLLFNTNQTKNDFIL